MEAVHLEAAVVAAAVVSGRRHHAERARLERHHHGGGVHVTELGELRIALHAAGGVHLDGVLPGDPAQHVEVVHRAVAEDAAGTGDVLHRRWRGIHRGAAHRVDETERTVVDRPFGRGERGVETPLVTDLHRHAGAGDDRRRPWRSPRRWRRSASRRTWESRARRRPVSARHAPASPRRPPRRRCPRRAACRPNQPVWHRVWRRLRRRAPAARR